MTEAPKAKKPAPPKRKITLEELKANDKRLRVNRAIFEGKLSRRNRPVVRGYNHPEQKK